MWNKWKESEFFKKLKQVRVNRAVYLSSVVILVALAVILAITAATNRATIDTGTPPADTSVGDGTQTPPDTAGGDKEPETDPPADTTGGKIPELGLPVAGKLVQKHSADVQVFSPTMQDYRIHLGVDITTEQGAPVCAVADGSVKQIWEDPLMGFCVALSHAGDCTTIYKNLAKEMAEGLTVGKAVKQGELLGYVGESAMLELAQEPHLHLEMTVGDLQVDPLDYFSATVLATLTEDTAYEGTLGK